MQRFTICGLRAFIDFVNETVPKIEGKHFEIQSAYGRHRIILKGDGGKYGTAAEDTHDGFETPRACANAFLMWLPSSTCPVECFNKVFDYMIKHSI